LGYLSKEYPTLAFHASITNPFGKGALLSLLRQLARMRTDKKYICVGFVGYPNVGKSSVINTLRTKKVPPLPSRSLPPTQEKKEFWRKRIAKNVLCNDHTHARTIVLEHMQGGAQTWGDQGVAVQSDGGLWGKQVCKVAPIPGETKVWHYNTVQSDAALWGEQVCKVAPIPGETKVWQYITLMKRIFLIDCPGVVYHRTADKESDIVLKGVTRVENLVGSSLYSFFIARPESPFTYFLGFWSCKLGFLPACPCAFLGCFLLFHHFCYFPV
jgi:50S ribosome-binding GTPase